MVQNEIQRRVLILLSFVPHARAHCECTCVPGESDECVTLWGQLCDTVLTSILDTTFAHNLGYLFVEAFDHVCARLCFTLDR